MFKVDRMTRQRVDENSRTAGTDAVIIGSGQGAAPRLSPIQDLVALQRPDGPQLYHEGFSPGVSAIRGHNIS